MRLCSHCEICCALSLVRNPFSQSELLVSAHTIMQTDQQVQHRSQVSSVMPSSSGYHNMDD